MGRRENNETCVWGPFHVASRPFEKINLRQWHTKFYVLCYGQRVLHARPEETSLAWAHQRQSTLATRFRPGQVPAGPDAKSFIATLLLVAAPIALFFGLVAGDVGKEVAWTAIITAAALSLLTYTSLLVTGLKNPGIIPRNAPPTVPLEQHDQQVQLDEGCRKGRWRVVAYIINGHEVLTKYCPTCSLFRPPRCSHCAVCDSCIEKFDHHCPWVGACIGRRNYQPYLTFIYTASLTCALYVSLCIALLVRLSQRDDFLAVLKEHWAAAIVSVYCACSLVFVGALSVFHTYLLSTNQTTYEYFRHRAANSNTFDRGIWHNCFEVFCGATGLYAYHADCRHPAMVRGDSVNPLRGGSRNGSMGRDPATQVSDARAAPYLYSEADGRPVRGTEFSAQKQVSPRSDLELATVAEDGQMWAPATPTNGLRPRSPARQPSQSPPVALQHRDINGAPPWSPQAQFSERPEAAPTDVHASSGDIYAPQMARRASMPRQQTPIRHLSSRMNGYH